MRKIFKQLFDSFLEKRKILIIYRLGRAVGDHLLMTGFIKLLKDQHQYKVYVFSNYPDLFKFNKKIEKI